MRDKIEEIKEFLLNTSVKQRVIAGVATLVVLLGCSTLVYQNSKHISARNDVNIAKNKKLAQHLKADKAQKAKADKEAKLKAEADKQAKLKAENEAKAKADSEAKAKAEAEQQAQAQAVAAEQAQQAQAAQEQAVAAEQAQAVAQQQAQPQQGYQASNNASTAPTYQAPAQSQPQVDWSQAGRDRDEYNASQGVNADGSKVVIAGGDPWAK